MFVSNFFNFCCAAKLFTLLVLNLTFSNLIPSYLSPLNNLLFLLVTEDQQQSLIREIFSLLAKRSDSVCNFLEGGSLTAFGKDTKLIYRHFATLYFVFAVDNAESELGILDLIQVFVEVLDKCFENVCELDIIFNSDKVHYILDEIVMGGMVLDTNTADIMEAIIDMNKLEQTSAKAHIKA